MKIAKLGWSNFRNLPDNQICANGRNVTISGRNGAGKTSIASVLPFILSGKIESKAFDEQGITLGDQTPSAFVEFDTGLKLRRDVLAGNKNRVFIDGKELSITQFNVRLAKLTGGVDGQILWSPFEFPLLHWKVQRDFLIENFAGDVQLPNPDEAAARLKSVKSQAKLLAGRIVEVQSQIKKYPDLDADKINARIAEIKAELDTLKAKVAAQNLDTTTLRNVVEDLNRQLSVNRRRLSSAQTCVEELRRKWAAVKKICPTCGQNLPVEAVKKARDEISALGRKTVAEAQTYQEEIRRISAQLETYQRQLAELETRKRAAFDAETNARIATLEREKLKLLSSFADMENRDNLLIRLHELFAEEKAANAAASDLGNEVAQIDYKRRLAMKKSEADVNAQFEHVKFKLFKVLTSGDIRETCEAMIGGVPYSSLSSGEKFRAGCDILNALQKKFGVEFPLMIDNAESYTPNSLIQLPNQLFLFKVADEDLKIVVG